MRKNLLILGAGEYGQFVREIAVATRRFRKISFLDDNSPLAVGALSDLKQLNGKYSCAFVAIGNTALRMQLLKELEENGYGVVTLVHPRAYVSPSAKLGEGSIVEPLAVVQSNAVIGKGTMVASGAVVKHNAVVGDGCYIDCNSVVLSDTKVPDGTKLSANTMTEAGR